MTALTDEQVEKIRTLLYHQGISRKDLANDMLDHLCCLAEQHMNSGNNFEDACEKTMHQFIPSSGLQSIQRQIQYSSNLKYIIMKKIILIAAAASLLFFFASTFLQGLRMIKGYDWDFMEGIAFINQYLITLFILPLYWVNQYYQSLLLSDGFGMLSKRTIMLIGFLCSETLVNAVFFKIMHLPGGNQLFMITAILGIVYIPFYALRKYRLTF